MALFLVPRFPVQLILAGMGSLFDCPSSWPSDERERDLRTGRQWLLAIQSYCKFRAGLAWRRSHDRFNPNRVWYTNGIRCVQDVISAPEPERQPFLPTLDCTPCFTDYERELGALSRGVLVDRLMASSSLFTDRRLLSYLPKMKLARMLARAEESVPAERRRA